MIGLPMSQRREVTFTQLHEVMPEVEHLLAGHATVGNWSLGQILNHLTAVIDASLDGGATPSPQMVAMLSDDDWRKRIANFRRRLLEARSDRRRSPNSFPSPCTAFGVRSCDRGAKVSRCRCSLLLGRGPPTGPPGTRSNDPNRMGAVPLRPLCAPPELCFAHVDRRSVRYITP